MIGAIFIGEGRSDDPLATIVAALFKENGVRVRMSVPDFTRLPRFSRDVASKLEAVEKLARSPDLFVIHRDADGRDPSPRRQEIAAAVDSVAAGRCHVPVVPIQATEAWLLLDEAQIRLVAGNPRGRVPLSLPSVSEVERRAGPKELLAEALLAASDETGRRRERVAKRFNEHRRRLLDMLDLNGAVSELASFQQLRADVVDAAGQLSLR